ncbi:hypothetical protein JZ751_014148 [Albula glossodonta]|uniref:G-protein coupled receptors family 1 profile domain-containing protein n=1 Tax=Albula glossodonta TaxID=121402 RepID=A0A8T2NVP2_9TELE|nr:hypothetical protein JZ751_014148 [Albula glossodonta]
MAARVGRNLVLLWTLRGANTHLCGGRNPVHPLLHDRQSAVDRKTYSLSLYRNLCMKPDQRLESTTGQQHTCRENMFTSLVSMGFTDTQVEQLARRTLNKCTDQTVIQHLATLSTLVTLGFSPSSLLKILNMCPELYQVKGALLQQRVDNLRKLGLLEGSLQRVVSHYPKILTVPIKRVTGMSRFLREKCLLSAQQVTDVLRDSPAIVLEDTSRLEYRFQYAYFRMGIQQEEMVKSGLFRVSTEEVQEEEGLESSDSEEEDEEDDEMVISMAPHHELSSAGAGGVEMSNITEQWYMDLQSWHMELFLIPTTAFTALALVADPLLMASILFSRALRQETRYLLLANTLLADTIFLVLNLATLICNSLGVRMVRPLCELVTTASVTAYCCSILTITLMVGDTYVAVRWPLHYHDRLPPSRTRKILAGVWLVAAMYPVSLVIVIEVLEESIPWRQPVCLVLLSMSFMGKEMMVGMHMYFFIAAALCTSLIMYCYIRLYAITKTSGIWQSRYSRARVTMMAHGIMLLLYFGPGLIFTVELVLFHRESVGHITSLWINMVNMSVLMPLPRACAPLLYGLRYREIHDTLLLLFHRRRLSQVTAA